MSAPNTPPRADQPGDDTEINHRQTTDVPTGVSGGRVGEDVEPTFGAC